MRLGARMSSGACAPVRTISGSATARKRHPVAMRSIWRTAMPPSVPAQTITA